LSCLGLGLVIVLLQGTRKARLGKARQGKARPGEARQDKAAQGKASLVFVLSGLLKRKTGAKAEGVEAEEHEVNEHKQR